MLRTYGLAGFLIALGMAVIPTTAMSMPVPPPAGSSPCDARYEDNTQANIGCELGSTNNDSEAQLNLDTIFGESDWEFIWKDENPPFPDPITEFTPDGAGNAYFGGEFTIDWDLTDYEEIVFVQKDGQDEPDTYVAWNLDPGDLGEQMYTFETPFLNTNTGNAKNISHVTFYGRGERDDPDNPDNPMPVPGTLLLMALGLGLVRYARVKSS